MAIIIILRATTGDPLSVGQKRVDFAAFTQAVMQLGFYWLVVNEEPPMNGSN